MSRHAFTPASDIWQLSCFRCSNLWRTNSKECRASSNSSSWLGGSCTKKMLRNADFGALRHGLLTWKQASSNSRPKLMRSQPQCQKNWFQMQFWTQAFLLNLEILSGNCSKLRQLASIHSGFRLRLHPGESVFTGRTYVFNLWNLEHPQSCLFARQAAEMSEGFVFCFGFCQCIFPAPCYPRAGLWLSWIDGSAFAQARKPCLSKLPSACLDDWNITYHSTTSYLLQEQNAIWTAGLSGHFATPSVPVVVKDDSPSMPAMATNPVMSGQECLTCFTIEYNILNRSFASQIHQFPIEIVFLEHLLHGPKASLTTTYEPAITMMRFQHQWAVVGNPITDGTSIPVSCHGGPSQQAWLNAFHDGCQVLWIDRAVKAKVCRLLHIQSLSIIGCNTNAFLCKMTEKEKTWKKNIASHDCYHYWWYYLIVILIPLLPVLLSPLLIFAIIIMSLSIVAIILSICYDHCDYYCLSLSMIKYYL